MRRAALGARLGTPPTLGRRSRVPGLDPKPCVACCQDLRRQASLEGDRRHVVGRQDAVLLLLVILQVLNVETLAPCLVSVDPSSMALVRSRVVEVMGHSLRDLP